MSSFTVPLQTIPEFRNILLKAIPRESEKKELSILLTHPWYSRFRENQEDRSSGDIADEIFHSIRLLSDLGVTEDQIRLYKGTPTCFLIATDKRMLVNPYPYEKEAYESFCLTVNNVERPASIYHQYITHHFTEPWSNRRGNALRYQYFRMLGPNPEQQLPDGPDFFVIQDAKEFYLAVFLRGAPSLPIAVEKIDTQDKPTEKISSDAARSFIPLGNDFRVRLLRITDNGENANWEEFNGQHYFNIERRRGKVIGTHPGDFNEYAMVGIFSAEPEKYDNPHKHKKEWAIPLLQAESLPLFWQWVREN